MYQVGNAKVRVHGTSSRERLETAVEKFIRSVETEKRKKANENTAYADGEMEARPKGVACC